MIRNLITKDFYRSIAPLARNPAGFVLPHVPGILPKLLRHLIEILPDLFAPLARNPVRFFPHLPEILRECLPEMLPELCLRLPETLSHLPEIVLTP